jgi:hypothetical protein
MQAEYRRGIPGGWRSNRRSWHRPSVFSQMPPKMPPESIGCPGIYPDVAGSLNPVFRRVFSGFSAISGRHWKQPEVYGSWDGWPPNCRAKSLNASRKSVTLKRKSQRTGKQRRTNLRSVEFLESRRNSGVLRAGGRRVSQISAPWADLRLRLSIGLAELP